MKKEYKDFIGIYQDVYPEGYCQHLIKEFERLVEMGAGYTRQQGNYAPKHSKDDMQVEYNIGRQTTASFNDVSVTRIFFDGLQQCYNDYIERFSVLKDAHINGSAMKMQRTDPGGGYHIWHAEQGNRQNSERVLVYMLYLNDLEEQDGGETEFLYQRLRLRPKANTMVVWPAAYTHTHRGNTVLGEKSKYIVTGWFYYE